MGPVIPGFASMIATRALAASAVALGKATPGGGVPLLAAAPAGHAAPLGVVPCVLAVVGGIVLAVALHEVGHALAGLAQGFRFVMLAVGPLLLSYTDGRLRARLNRTLSMWGGMTVTVPSNAERTVRRFAWAVAGGPAASLALAAGAAAAWAAVPSEFGVLRLCLAATAVSSVVIVLVTAQPFGAGGGFASDGGRLLRLLRGGEAGAQEAALLSLFALAVAGVRPREWPTDAVATLRGVGGGGPWEVASCAMVAQHCLDRGELGCASEAVDRLLALWPRQHELVRAGVAADLAFFLAFVRGEPGRARSILAEARGPLVEPHRVLRARAAVALAEGDREGALAAAAAAAEALARPFLEANAMDRELVDEIATRARTHLDPAGQNQEGAEQRQSGHGPAEGAVLPREGG